MNHESSTWDWLSKFSMGADHEVWVGSVEGVELLSNRLLTLGGSPHAALLVCCSLGALAGCLRLYIPNL